MSQHDQVIDNAPGQTVRTDINAAIGALFSSSSGPVEPVVKDPGQIWFDTSTPSIMRLAVRDQTNATWVNAVLAPSTLAAGDTVEASGPNSFVGVPGGTVHRAGDTMTGGLKITKPYAAVGDEALTIAPLTGGALMVMTRPAGASNIIQGRTGANARWQIALGNNTVETGSNNIGSDFTISRFNDAGVFIDNPLTINRTGGGASFAAAVTVAPASGPANLQVNAVAGQASNLYGYNHGVVRWQLCLGNGAAETGGNAGNDFQIAQYNDAGALLGVPLVITRSSSTITAASRLQTNYGYTCRNGIGGGYGANVFNFFYSAGVMQMWADATNMGNISVASDYRIKKDVAPLASTWDRVKALRPISYTHKDYTPPNAPRQENGDPPGPLVTDDDIERWGFIAHELQDALIPDAATGVKDQVDCVQSPNPWTVLAVLTKALQEAMNRIEVLEAAAGA